MGVRRSAIFNPMGLPTSVQASRGNGSYLTTQDMSKSASLKPVDVPLVAMDPLLGSAAFPESDTYMTGRAATRIVNRIRRRMGLSGLGEDPVVPVDVKNGPPNWLYYMTAIASVGSFIYLLTRNKK